MALRSSLINVMADSARHAARPLLRDFGELQQLQVSKRTPAKFAAAARARCEQALRRDLAHGRPGYGLVVPPGPGPLQWPPTPGQTSCWLVNPLSGINNFAHGVPHFCVSIAVLSDVALVACVVYDPLRDETFWAEHGSGAYLNHQRLRVSARDELGSALLGFAGRPALGAAGRHEGLYELSRHGAGLRQSGSVALDLAYVAAGRYDGCLAFNDDPVTLAAGVPLVREAGGFTSAMDGADNGWSTGDLVAANPHLHPRLVQTMRPA